MQNVRSVVSFLSVLFFFLVPSFGQTPPGTVAQQHPENVRDGWKVLDSAGNPVVEVGGGTAKVTWDGNGESTRNSEAKTITLPAGAKVKKVTGSAGELKVKADGVEVDNDKDDAKVDVTGDGTKLLIDKKGTYTTNGKDQEITVQGSSAGRFSGSFSGGGSITVNGKDGGTYTTSGGWKISH